MDQEGLCVCQEVAQVCAEMLLVLLEILPAAVGLAELERDVAALDVGALHDDLRRVLFDPTAADGEAVGTAEIPHNG